MSLRDIRKLIHDTGVRYKESGRDRDLLAHLRAYRSYYRYQLKAEFSADVKESLDKVEAKIKSMGAAEASNLPCGSCTVPRKLSRCGTYDFVNCRFYRGPAGDLVKFGCSSKIES